MSDSSGQVERPVHDIIADAFAHHQEGDLGSARQLCVDALGIDPEQPDAWHLLGALASQQGNFEEAIDLLRSAIRIKSAFPEALCTLGNTYKAAGDLDKAEGAFRQACHLDEHLAVVHNNLGNVLRLKGDHASAFRAYDKATVADPNYAEAYYNKSVSLLDLGHDDDAIEAARHAIGLMPGFVAAHVAVARAHDRKKQFVESLKWHAKALDLAGDDPETIYSAAATLEKLGALEAAAQFYQRVVELDRDYTMALSRLVDITLTLCDWSHYDEFVRGLIARTEREVKDGTSLTLDVFNLQALPVTSDFLLRAARGQSAAISKRVPAPLTPRPATPRRGKGRKLRIGYALPYTWFHSLPMILKEIVEHHDRDRFEVCGYCIQKCDGSDFDRDYRAAFDVFGDIHQSALKAGAQQIERDRIDVLIDVTGHTATNCMELMAWRPAPVQAHFLGYSITTGAGFIDYLITDRVFMPPDRGGCCSEKLVYMPDSFLVAPRAPIAAGPIERRDVGLPEDAFVFANFNHPCKFEPIIFGAWMEIMAQVPNSVLWLGQWKAVTQGNLRQEAEKLGIDGERLLFADIVDHPDHLARLAFADLALDNYFHGGGITTTDALWSGLPVVSVAGELPASRNGATLLTCAGLPELITSTLAEYVETAVALDRDRQRLASYRQRLTETRQESPLFDIARYTRHLESAVELMWENYASGAAPRNLTVPPYDAT